MRYSSKNSKKGQEYIKVILERQGYKCAICEDDNNGLVVDHDHFTGHIRGMLCPDCNRSVSERLEKNLRRAHKYLNISDDKMLIQYEEDKAELMILLKRYSETIPELEKIINDLIDKQNKLYKTPVLCDHIKSVISSFSNESDEDYLSQEEFATKYGLRRV